MWLDTHSMQGSEEDQWKTEDKRPSPTCERHGDLARCAEEIVKALRLSKWRLVKDPPNPPHSTFGPKRDEK
jgi:hypothetical protein